MLRGAWLQQDMGPFASFASGAESVTEWVSDPGDSSRQMGDPFARELSAGLAALLAQEHVAVSLGET